MELSELIRPGMQREESFRVDEDKTAIHVGSGASRVLATPWMIAFMERVSHRLIAQVLPEDSSSVGTVVNVRHLAPSPVGSQVRVRAEVTGIEGQRVTLFVQAWDHVGQVGEGSHERMVIDLARFLRRVESRKPAADLPGGA